MCFKKPKPPEKSAEDIAAEKELEEQLAARKRELAETRREDKEGRTEEDIARALGLFGMRSLITGPKGGAGFGRSFRSIKPVAAKGGSRGGSRPSAPATSSDRTPSGYGASSPRTVSGAGTIGTSKSLVSLR